MRPVKPQMVNKMNEMSASPATAPSARAAGFIHGLQPFAIPAAARHAATRALYDTFGGVAAADAVRTKLMGLASPVIGEARASRLLADIEGLWQAESAGSVIADVTVPV